jgi:hypothetical protein
MVRARASRSSTTTETGAATTSPASATGALVPVREDLRGLDDRQKLLKHAPARAFRQVWTAVMIAELLPMQAVSALYCVVHAPPVSRQSRTAIVWLGQDSYVHEYC